MINETNANQATMREIVESLKEQFKYDNLSDEKKKKLLIEQMLDGEVDIHQIHNSPDSELEWQLSEEIDTLYNEAAQSGYHLDDDVEAIYESILRKYEHQTN